MAAAEVQHWIEQAELRSNCKSQMMEAMGSTSAEHRGVPEVDRKELDGVSMKEGFGHSLAG